MKLNQVVKLYLVFILEMKNRFLVYDYHRLGSDLGSKVKAKIYALSQLKYSLKFPKPFQDLKGAARPNFILTQDLFGEAWTRFHHDLAIWWWQGFGKTLFNLVMTGIDQN